jgi:hypothetical protein
MARPSLFTVPRLLIFQAAVVTEPTLAAACGRAGLSTETVRRWRTAKPPLVLPGEVRVPDPDHRDRWTDYGGLPFPDALERAVALRHTRILAIHRAVIEADGRLCVCGRPARPGHRVSYNPESNTFTVEVFR